MRLDCILHKHISVHGNICVYFLQFMQFYVYARVILLEPQTNLYFDRLTVQNVEPKSFQTRGCLGSIHHLGCSDLPSLKLTAKAPENGCLEYL